MENKDLDYEKIQKKLKSKRKPNICMQFDIMSYLLSKKDYDSLQQALNIGYNPRIEIETNKERKTLLDQSVISNDKKALTMFYNKIKTNGLSVYKNVGSETIEEVLQIELANTLGRLIHDTSMKDMDKIKLIKLLEERSRIVREALQNLGVVINSEHLKNAVVKNDAIVFRVAYHLIPEAPEAKRTEIALDALYKLIDYRIQQGS